MLTKDEVLKIAKLARLSLTEAEVESYQTRLGRVLEYIKELSQLKTPADAFVKHVPRDAVNFREDKAVPFGAVKEILKNAPSSEADSFVLPPIIEHT